MSITTDSVALVTASSQYLKLYVPLWYSNGIVQILYNTSGLDFPIVFIYLPMCTFSARLCTLYYQFTSVIVPLVQNV